MLESTVDGFGGAVRCAGPVEVGQDVFGTAGQGAPEAAQFVEDKQKEEFIRSQQHKLAKKSRARRSSADKK